MGKSGLSGQELPEKKKKIFAKKNASVFYVRDIPKHINLNMFDPDIRIDLDAAIRLSEIKGKLTAADIPSIQLKS
ncbi:hypothetical protein [Dyadobacter sp. CY323]|uniref:hypothetical protein n=1 Tax=Dyadobacter sp. CY323 TaxID=2907302 RepID=UPI001F16F0ED|nr:hypothetical protein [Dyadobacter sp. CY323]MCE6991657.1 hypothetical protein [Dyadobacter sp. CY323]